MIYAKVAMGAVAVAALAAAGLTAARWHRAAQELPVARAELAAARSAAIASADLQRAVVKGLADENLELRALRERVPVRVVRVPIAAAVPAASDPTGGGPPAAAGGGELPAVFGSDIGPRLYALADAGDALAARLRGCQQVIRGIDSSVF